MDSVIASRTNSRLSEKEKQVIIQKLRERRQREINIFHQKARSAIQQIGQKSALEEQKRARNRQNLDSVSRIDNKYSSRVPESEKDNVSDAFRQQIHPQRVELFQQGQIEAKEGGKKISKFRKLSSRFLVNYWKAFLETWGATLILIDLHVLARLSFGTRFFCKLGHEWGETLYPAATKSKKSRELLERMGNKIGVIEALLVGLLNIVALAIILAALTFLAIIAYVLTEPFQALKLFFRWVFTRVYL